MFKLILILIVSKLFDVFVNLDKMIGKDFEVSLANLKIVAEGK